jgi:hypothetical protein
LAAPIVSLESLLTDLHYQITGNVTIFAARISQRYETAGGYSRFKVPSKLAEILTAILGLSVTPEQVLEFQHRDRGAPTLTAAADASRTSRLSEAQTVHGPLYWELVSLRIARGGAPSDVSVSGGSFVERVVGSSDVEAIRVPYRIGKDEVRNVFGCVRPLIPHGHHPTRLRSRRW